MICLFNKKLWAISFLILTSSLTIACEKKGVEKEDITIENIQDSEENKKIEELSIDKKIFKDYAELKSFSKSQMNLFENILKSNKIEYVSTSDNSLVINKNRTYEKYTKEFNQLAYSNIVKDFESGTGYLKTGLKLNVHLEEQVSLEHNFIKAMLNIVKTYNPNIDEEKFDNEIKLATQNPENLTDVDISTGVKGLVIKVYSRPDINEREIVLSIRQELEIPKSEELLKEYKTVQEFKNDSDKIEQATNEKIARLNEILKNSYIGKYKDLEVSLIKFEADYGSKFSQSAEVQYKGTEITSIQDELLDGLYEIIENILSKEKVSKILTSDEFKAYVKSLEVYAGAHTTGSIVDELGETIEPSKLPFISEVELSISFSSAVPKESSSKENIDKNTNVINTYNSIINLKVGIPIKAEGITSL